MRERDGGWGKMAACAWSSTRERRSRTSAGVKRLVHKLAVGLVPLAIIVTTTTVGPGASAASTSGGAPVPIGLPYPIDLAGLPDILGGGSGSSGATFPSNQTTQAVYQSVVNYVNSHGGLLGRKIDPIYYGEDVLTASGSVTDQQVCTYYTQDHRVFAVMAPFAHTTTLTSCLESKGVMDMDAAGYTEFDDATFAQYPLYATAGTLSLTRVAAAEVNGLWNEGYFGKGSAAKDDKIGLLAYNTPGFTQAINTVLKPALARHGLKLTDHQLVAPIQGVADVGPTQTMINSTVLRFKTEGINHVIFLDVEGALVMPFVSAETPQLYYPRLGMTSDENPANRAYLGNTNDHDQLNQFHDALAVGWDPALDVAHPASNDQGALCTKIMEGGGASPAQATLFWNVCDQLITFAAGVNAGGKLTASAAIKGLAFAKNIPSAELLGPANYAGGRRDGVVTGRYLAFQNSCQCFQYTSPAFPLSSIEGY